MPAVSLCMLGFPQLPVTWHGGHRWCSLPQWRSYGVVAKEVIKQGEPIGAYVGTLRTEKDFNAEFEGRGSQVNARLQEFRWCVYVCNVPCKRTLHRTHYMSRCLRACLRL